MTHVAPHVSDICFGVLRKDDKYVNAPCMYAQLHIWEAMMMSFILLHVSMICVMCHVCMVVFQVPIACHFTCMHEKHWYRSRAASASHEDELQNKTWRVLVQGSSHMYAYANANPLATHYDDTTLSDALLCMQHLASCWFSILTPGPLPLMHRFDCCCLLLLC
jgi:ABC-type siderophore export system fused ATPase/permease subunit